MLRRKVGGLCIALTMLGALAAGSASAVEPSDKDSDGDFTGLALITDDLKWYEAFNRPETPNLNRRDSLLAGEQGTLALIFASAEAKDGKHSIVCDIVAFDPRGRRTLVEGRSCYEGPARRPYILVPTLLAIDFRITDEDPVGEAGFEITMKDMYSGREVQLTVSFMQGGDN